MPVTVDQPGYSYAIDLASLIVYYDTDEFGNSTAVRFDEYLPDEGRPFDAATFFGADLEADWHTARRDEHPIAAVFDDALDAALRRQRLARPPRLIVGDVLSVSQAAGELGLTRDAVYKAVRAGRLPQRKIGNLAVLLHPDVAAYKVAEKDKGGRPRKEA
jgi:excisionase family DNA binding protein